jgi:hypothetical protein
MRPAHFKSIGTALSTYFRLGFRDGSACLAVGNVAVGVVEDLKERRRFYPRFSDTIYDASVIADISILLHRVKALESRAGPGICR